MAQIKHKASSYWKIKHFEDYLKILKDEKTRGTVTRDEVNDAEIKLMLMKSSWEAGYVEGVNDKLDKEKHDTK